MDQKISKIVFENYTKIRNILVADTTTINIEIANDTIWRYTKQAEKQIGDYYRIEKSNGKLYSHAQIDKNLFYREDDLFNSEDQYQIKEQPDEKKMILGFLCYKVIIERSVYDKDAGVTEKTSYEMYVTKNIDLPIHALLNTTKLFDNFFPLEIYATEFRSGSTEYYKAKYIE